MKHTAEKTLISAVLINPAIFKEMSGQLELEAFTDRKMRHIWSLFERLHAQNKPIDLVSLDSIGADIAELSELAESDTATLNWKHYFKVLQNTANNNKLLVKLEKFQDEIRSDETVNWQHVDLDRKLEIDRSKQDADELIIETLDDSPPDPTKWVIKGFLQEEACMLIGAEEKSGKTWITFDASISIVTGNSLLGLFVPILQGPVLIYSPESGVNNIKARLWGLCWAHGLDPKDVLRHIYFVRSRIDLGRLSCVQAIKRAIDRIKPVAIVLDPLITLQLGIDENNSGEMQGLLDQIRLLGVPTMVCHHVGKMQNGKSNFHAVRGSTAIGGWSDGIVSIRKLKQTELGIPRSMRIEHRDGLSPRPCGFTIQQVSIPDIPDGLYGFRLDQYELDLDDTGNQRAGRPRSPEIRAEIKCCISENPGISRYGIENATCRNPRTVKQYVQVLIDNVEVVEKDNGLHVVYGNTCTND